METGVFERVVQEHKDRVHSFATRMLQDPTEAQDVAQEALVRLWRNRRRVEPEGARPWLMRTVHNLCIDRIRKRKVRSEIADADPAIELQTDGNPDAEQRIGSTELGRAIEQAVRSLSEQDRAVVLMREVHEMPYEEIAAALDLPLGTLKARLHRARERLRAKLVRVGVTP